MKTLHELATKLQTHIIKSQTDAHNETNLNVTKYNNLKLRMETKLHYPNVIVCIGISEAVFNIQDGTKTDGGLGPDEKYVRKWLGNSTTISDLKEIYIAMSDLIKAEEANKAIAMEGEADEAKKEPTRKHKKPLTEEELVQLDAESVLGEEPEEEEEGEELMSVEESLTHKEEHEVDESDMETVDHMKKNLKDYMRSRLRRI